MTQVQHVQVAVLGTGFAGLGMAIRLKRRGVTDFVVFERAVGLKPLTLARGLVRPLLAALAMAATVLAVQQASPDLPLLRLVLGILTRAHYDDPATTQLDEAALYRIVVAEASKSYLTKEVDADNRAGLFREYKQLAADLVAMVLEIRPDYAFPHALASTLLEASRKQLFFAQHLPSLTDAAGSGASSVLPFIEQLAFAALA